MPANTILTRSTTAPDAWTITAPDAEPVTLASFADAVKVAKAVATGTALDDALFDLGYWDDDRPEDYFVCECELDWNCPLHSGRPTGIERINDAWAFEQSEQDRQGGWS